MKELTPIKDNTIDRICNELLRKPTYINIKCFEENKSPLSMRNNKDPAHKVHLPEQWLEYNDIQCITWPNQFLDWNMIEIK